VIDIPESLRGALAIADVVELHELLARYGHLIDERVFSRFGEVFVPDVVYDVSDFGVPVIRGLAELIDFMATETRHPLAHHSTNVLLTLRADGVVGILSKGIGVRHGGRTSSVTYLDQAVKGPDGWRLTSRKAVLRR
jgi:SnoaL-like domain